MLQGERVLERGSVRGLARSGRAFAAGLFNRAAQALSDESSDIPDEGSNIPAAPPAHPPPPPAYQGRAISTLEELDEMLRQADEARQISDAALRAHLEAFWMKMPPAPGADDPFSAAYREHQMSVYRHLAGKPYDTSNEAQPFELELHIRKPYPYITGTANTVGQQLIAAGYIIQAMDLPAGASIMELGIGWGNIALALAQMGCEVHAIDIEQNFVDLVGRRAANNYVNIHVKKGTFFSLAEVERTFDAILFYEAFHHCDDHLRLLDVVAEKLNPGGKLVLAGEPIDDRIPYPWGINPHGMGIWSIRQYGWLELSFTEDYFLSMLQRKGWTVVKHDCPLTAAGITYVAQRG